MTGREKKRERKFGQSWGGRSDGGRSDRGQFLDRKSTKTPRKTGTNTKDNKKKLGSKEYPETALKNDFFTRNAIRNREAIEVKKNRKKRERTKGWKTHDKQNKPKKKNDKKTLLGQGLGQKRCWAKRGLGQTRSGPKVVGPKRSLSKILAVPVGQPEFVLSFLERKSEEQSTLFQRIPAVEDPQAAWLLLLMCAAPSRGRISG